MFNTFVFITFGYGLFLLITGYRRVKVRTAGLSDQQEWISSLFGPAWIMVASLFANALAFMRTALVQREMDAMAEATWDSGRFFLGASADVMACTLGTGLLMAIVVGALDDDEIYDADTPHGAGLRAQAIMFRRLLVRHWLAVFGLGTVFGVAGGSGVVLLLAGELTLMWAGCAIGLKIMERRGSTQPVWEQGCDVTGPDARRPVSVSNSDSDSTPPTHSGTDHDNRPERRAA